MEVDTVSCLIGQVSIIIAYFLGKTFGFIHRVWRDGQVRQ